MAVKSLLNVNYAGWMQSIFAYIKFKLKMKKITVYIVSLLILQLSFAQNVSDKIVLSKNQKLDATTTTKGTVSIDMMGQSMETITETVVNSTVEVKEVKPTGYVLTTTLNKMKVKTSGGMAPPVDFDTEKKEDMSSEMGKTISAKLQPSDVEILLNGKPVENKDNKDATEDITKVMQSIMGGSAENGISGVFMLLPAGKKTGDTWSDSSNTDGLKIHNTYILKEINGNEATITVNTTASISKVVEAQGAELTVTMDSKINSDNIVELTSGLIKEKKMTIEGQGNLAAGGQEMPMTTKVTSVTKVKSL